MNLRWLALLMLPFWVFVDFKTYIRGTQMQLGKKWFAAGFIKLGLTINNIKFYQNYENQ